MSHTDNAPDLASEHAIDAWCLEYENLWRSESQAPDIAAFLLRAGSDSERLHLLRALLELDSAYRVRLGQPLAEDDYAHLAEELQVEVAAFFRKQGGPAAPAVGQTLGRFQLLEVLGEGGFGTVFRARDSVLHREVALKTPRAADSWTRDRAVRFLEEARAAARISHPRLAKIHDVQRTSEGHCYLVSPLLRGESLRSRASRAALSPLDSVRTVREVAEAVQAMHQAGLIHRDLSPDNIMLDAEQGPVVIDFGLAVASNDTASRQVAGSLRYMAPEQLDEGEPVDGRADIWALGVVLFELLAGEPPFAGEGRELTERILHEPPSPAADSMPIGLRDICLRCLQKSPDDRFPNATELAAALSAWESRHQSRRRWLLLAAAAAGGAGLTLAFQPWRTTPAPAGRLGALDVDLLVWRDAWRRMRPDHALTLVDGDRIQLQVRSTSASYVYVLWREADGRVQPLSPFVDGAWSLPPRQEPVRRLSLPAGSARSAWRWRNSGEGFEAVLAARADRPLRNRDVADLREVLDRPWPHRDTPSPWCGLFVDGEPASSRGVRPGATVMVEHPLLDAQRALSEELGRWFESTTVLVF